MGIRDVPWWQRCRFDNDLTLDASKQTSRLKCGALIFVHYYAIDD